MHNDILLPEVIKSKASGIITPALGKMLIEIANTIGNKPQHKNNPLREDMVQHAVAEMYRIGLHFDPSKSSNPYAWFVTITIGSFLNIIAKEKQQREISTLGVISK
jgi:DNA-directed RNA polymerase specialized sigma24 family protein